MVVTRRIKTIGQLVNCTHEEIKLLECPHPQIMLSGSLKSAAYVRDLFIDCPHKLVH